MNIIYKGLLIAILIVSCTTTKNKKEDPIEKQIDKIEKIIKIPQSIKDRVLK